MKKQILFLSIALLAISRSVIAQDVYSKDSSTVVVDNRVLLLEGFPCDSLYKIKGLRNVTCDNYGCFTHADYLRVMDRANYLLLELNKKHPNLDKGIK